MDTNKPFVTQHFLLHRWLFRFFVLNSVSLQGLLVTFLTASTKYWKEATKGLLWLPGMVGGYGHGSRAVWIVLGCAYLHRTGNRERGEEARPGLSLTAFCSRDLFPAGGVPPLKGSKFWENSSPRWGPCILTHDCAGTVQLSELWQKICIEAPLAFTATVRSFGTGWHSYARSYVKN